MNKESKSIIRPNEWIICWGNNGKEIIFGIKKSNGEEEELKLPKEQLFKLQHHINHLIDYGFNNRYLM